MIAAVPDPRHHCAAAPTRRVCRVCGCHTYQACITDDGPCWFPDDSDDICSACLPADSREGASR